MAVSYVLYLRTDKKLKDGRCPVYLRIIENRKSKYKSTGVKVAPKHWNANRKKVRKSHPNYKTLNQLLQQAVREVQQIQASITTGENKLAAIKAKLEGDKTNFFKLAAAVMEEIEQQASYYTYKNHKVALKKIREFHGSNDLLLREIDLQFLNNFEQHLKTQYGNAASTISKNFRTLKKIIKKADKAGIIDRNPFFRFEGAKDAKAKQKTKLSFQQIKDIQGLLLKPGTNIYHSRNAFLFSFYSGGIRFGDICRLKWRDIQDGKLCYRMAKNEKPFEIELNQPQRELLELYESDSGYIFPFLNSHRDYTETSVRKVISSQNAIINSCLKDIADKAGIDKHLSFHIARHSFAQHAIESGLSMYELMQALRHSKLETTQQYLKTLDSQLANKAMKKVF